MGKEILTEEGQVLKNLLCTVLPLRHLTAILTTCRSVDSKRVLEHLHVHCSSECFPRTLISVVWQSGESNPKLLHGGQCCYLLPSTSHCQGRLVIQAFFMSLNK